MGIERRREAAVILLGIALAASPAYNVRFHVGPIPSTLLEVLLILALAASATAVDGLPRVPRWVLLGAALLLLGATIGIAASPVKLKALGIWRAYFVEPMLVAAAIAVVVRTVRDARVILLGLGVAGAIVSAANIAVSATALAHRSFNLITPPVAIYTSSNAVPLYLIPLAAFALALALHAPGRSDRIAAGAFYALYALAVLLSYSRAGWATLIVVSVVVAAFGRVGRRVAVPLLLAAPLAILALPGARRRVAVEFDLSNPYNTITSRVTLWRSALNLLRHKPLFGGGLAGFTVSVDPYSDAGYRATAVCCIYPHNILLDFWTETTIVGLVGFLVLAVALLGISRTAIGAGGMTRSLGIGMVGLLVAFGVHGIADNPYFKNDQALAFWALAGLLVATMERPWERLFSGRR